MEGIFAILGVLLGYYLAKHQEINTRIAQKIGQIKESRKPQWGEPFVIRPDEAKLEKEQKAKEKEIISLKDYLE